MIPELPFCAIRQTLSQTLLPGAAGNCDAFVFCWVMSHLLHNDGLAAVIAGGVFMGIAGWLMQRATDAGDERVARPELTREKEVAVQ